ncbi:MAG: hypothetical protein Q7J62_00130 [Polaromonas sp.]|nr:hypothetical protein [Polaromonas sp.]MDO8742805.1 hypothetical protein [Polaromonas sp.]
MPAIERLLDGIHALMFVKYAEKQLKPINLLSQISGSRSWRVASRDNKNLSVNNGGSRWGAIGMSCPASGA